MNEYESMESTVDEICHSIRTETDKWTCDPVSLNNKEKNLRLKRSSKGFAHAIQDEYAGAVYNSTQVFSELQGKRISKAFSEYMDNQKKEIQNDIKAKFPKTGDYSEPVEQEPFKPKFTPAEELRRLFKREKK